jgi:transcriptional repressor NrdR
MDCPRCNQGTHVLESRRAEDGAALRRRRECVACSHRFTTFERREPEPAFVHKRDGRRQRFDRTKLRAALLGATHKRPVSANDVEALIDRVEVAIESAGGELGAERIATLCLDGLRALDAGAYLQFAGTLPSARVDLAVGETSGSVRGAREPSEFTVKTTS